MPCPLHFNFRNDLFKMINVLGAFGNVHRQPKLMDSINQILFCLRFDPASYKFFEFMPEALNGVQIRWFGRRLPPIYICIIIVLVRQPRAVLWVIVLYEFTAVRIGIPDKRNEGLLQNLCKQRSVHPSFKNTGPCSSSPANACPHMKLNWVLWLGLVSRLATFLVAGI